MTVNGALWPVARTKGNESPLKVNSEVPTVAEETVTLEPVALSVPVKLALAPTTTLPKFRVVGVRFNCPAAIPVPDKKIVMGELEASEITEMLALLVPVKVGAKTISKVKLCPGVKVRDGFNPLTANPEPLTVTCVTMTSESPELVRVSD